MLSKFLKMILTHNCNREAKGSTLLSLTKSVAINYNYFNCSESVPHVTKRARDILEKNG
jgi:hypothetical protein